jgi:GTP-binding protein HflX
LNATINIKEMQIPNNMLVSRNNPEGAILVSANVGHDGIFDSEYLLDELGRLANTAGADVIATLIQKKGRITPRYLLSKGKFEELKALVANTSTDIVIFDEELNPTQQSNISSELKCKVIDRTALILDIFAMHAHTHEGRLQVELAQLNYLLPRLKGKGLALSRLGGGIGTRGPGETKLEVDRRRIRSRIRVLNSKFAALGIQRDVQRKRRRKQNVPEVSLVGYTNAGKSTILNTLTTANVLVEDKLFSTLDPTTRRVRTLNGKLFLLSDTVGFIEKLPHQLIAAFKSTLDEVKESEVIIKVVDVSDPDFKRRLDAVIEVLGEIGCADKKSIISFNKTDLCAENNINRLKSLYPEAVFISAKNRAGLSDLVARVESMLSIEAMPSDYPSEY